MNGTLRQKINNLPNSTGVYQFKDSGGNILYVGKAVNLRSRVRQYFRKSSGKSPRIDAMIAKIHDLELIVTDSEVEALILEATLIKKVKPRYNVDLKDDKTYPYIVVTNEPYPRIYVTRKIVRDGSKYFGPYTDVTSMRSSLKMIRDIFKVRSCNYHIDEEVIKKQRIRLCLDYHINKCEGPCGGLTTRGQYDKMIGEVVQLLKGRTTKLIAELNEKMETESEGMRFEEAAKLRDKIRQLSVYNERQKVVDTDLKDRDVFAVSTKDDNACGVVLNIREGKIVGKKHIRISYVRDKKEEEILEQFVVRYYLEQQDYPSEIFLPCRLTGSATIQRWLSGKKGGKIVITVPQIGEKRKLLAMGKANAELLLSEYELQKEKHKSRSSHSSMSLQRDLSLAAIPRRIECIDISHFQGTDSVASVVLFVDGKPMRSGYRKYKIRSVEGSDDFASIREVVGRRYKRLVAEKDQLPDLIVIDGGKGQLSGAVEVLERLGLCDNLRCNSLSEMRLPVVGLAKRLEEVFVPGHPEALSIPKTSDGLKLLRRIRDEAHRFALTYHIALRGNRTIETELESIEGVGEKRAKKLIEHFGSVRAVRSGNYDQLVKIAGEKAASRIRDYFGE